MIQGVWEGQNSPQAGEREEKIPEEDSEGMEGLVGRFAGSSVNGVNGGTRKN